MPVQQADHVDEAGDAALLPLQTSPSTPNEQLAIEREHPIVQPTPPGVSVEPVRMVSWRGTRKSPKTTPSRSSDAQRRECFSGQSSSASAWTIQQWAARGRQSTWEASRRSDAAQGTTSEAHGLPRRSGCPKVLGRVSGGVERNHRARFATADTLRPFDTGHPDAVIHVVAAQEWRGGTCWRCRVHAAA